MNLKSDFFGILPDGCQAKLFTLKNDNNVTVKITNYGAIVASIETPDKQGNITNVVLGFDNLEGYISKDYLNSYPYFGCVCGRCANRIAEGKLEIEGTEYQLAINNGPNHLHGGLIGYDKKLWNAEPFEEADRVGVKLTLFSPHLEENYPGNLEVTCIYSLNNRNDFAIEYIAGTDKTTIVNLTNHTYFNFTGGADNILEHELMLNAEKMTESVDLIPTGRLIEVKDTPFDFTSQRKIVKDMASLEQGYDNNFVLDNPEGKLLLAGCLSEGTSGRKMEVYTTQPGIQLYTGYWIPELRVGNVKKFGSYSGVALETQHYPDSVHHSNFPSVFLSPGEKYYEKTIYRFIF